MNFNALNLLRSYMFGVGSNHNAVRTIKTFLNSNSTVKISDLKQNALFDAETRTALAQFQNSKGLAPTGAMNLKTWFAIGAEMNPISIQVASMGDKRLRDLLGLGYVSTRANRKSFTNISLDSVIRTSSASQAGVGASYNFSFFIYLSIFAPFDWFGPLDLSKGDGAGRKFGTKRGASYRLQCFSTVPVAPGNNQYQWATTQAAAPTNSYIWLPLNLGPKSEKSEGHLDDYKNDTYADKISKEVDGNSAFLNYHVYGNDDAFALWGGDSAVASNIDVHTTYNFTWEPQADPKKVIIHASGKIVGDQFPCVETFVLDKNDNGVMLGVWQINQEDGPVFTKDGDFGIIGDKMLPMIDFDLKIMTENGIFTGVVKNGIVVSLAEHNSYYTKLSPVKPKYAGPLAAPDIRPKQ